MTEYKTTNIEWEYVNLRNISLLQISVWAKGLNNPGFYPPSKFSFGNYIGAGEKGVGNHGIFDKNLMKEVLRKLQKEIDYTPDFEKRINKRANKIYDNLKKTSRQLRIIKTGNQNDLILKYNNFKRAITFAPIILMPMYAVDGCLDENYHLIEFLRKKVKKEEIGIYVSMLSATKKKTVAYLEKESLLNIAKETNMCGVINIRKNRSIMNMLSKHAERFCWVGSEYLSDESDLNDYIIRLKKEAKNPEKELQKMRNKRSNALAVKKLVLIAYPPVLNRMALRQSTYV